MKIQHTEICPICQQPLTKTEINRLYSINHLQPSPPFAAADIFICCSPLASDPLHYYNHTVKKDESDWIIFQEFSVDLGSKYVLFRNDYTVDRSFIESDKEIAVLEIPVLLIPDFPKLESLKKKIRTSITFS